MMWQFLHCIWVKHQSLCHVAITHFLAPWHTFVGDAGELTPEAANPHGPSDNVEGENLGSLSLAKDATFTLDVREGGGTEVRKAVEVSSAQQHELAGSKGTAHFVMKFDKSSRSEACINILDPTTTPALKGVLGPVTGKLSPALRPLTPNRLCPGTLPAGPPAQHSDVRCSGSQAHLPRVPSDPKLPGRHVQAQIVRPAASWRWQPSSAGAWSQWATLQGSCQWQDVDLSLGEWTEYDDKAQESVGVYSIESQFKLHKC
ncbi:uncharacterized protein HaLaN_16393 [Haematococcus lacustris]|uniref:Uncharacterized protein n=1 Tax=Haematococcus lacustris TaxID=44745 RepID=A0A699Z9W4_HAELA|nr:uncharacterized protein HaLaN_16393 [Haematococcus lacustris]